MKEIVRKRKSETPLTAEQIESLKSLGRIQAKTLDHLTEYIPTDPNKPMWEWVFNQSNNILVIGDLNFTVGPKEIVFLPKFFDKDKINSSVGIRNAIMVFKSLVAIKDPTFLTEGDLEIEPPLIDTLSQGDHDMEDTMNKIDPDYQNPHIEGLIDYEEKEKAAIERGLSGAKVGEERRRKKRNK